MSKLERLNRHGTRRHFTTAGIAWGHEHRHTPGRAESEAQQQQQQGDELTCGTVARIRRSTPGARSARGCRRHCAGREQQRRRWRGVPLGRTPPRRDGREVVEPWMGSGRGVGDGRRPDQTRTDAVVRSAGFVVRLSPTKYQNRDPYLFYVVHSVFTGENRSPTE